MAAVLVNLSGLVLIGFIVYWFWLSKPNTAMVANGVISIVVDNGVYTPSRIEVATGQVVTLRFLRKDPNPCAAKVIFAELGISKELSLNNEVEITLRPETPGEFAFNCDMQMYRGILVVRS